MARYVWAHGLRVGLGLAVPSAVQRSPTAMTVAVVGESDTRWGAAAVVARLAELATRDELLVIYGCDTAPGSRRDTNVLLAGLRERLPRHRVVAVRVGPGIGSPGGNAALVGEFVESGAVPIAVAPTVEVGDVAAQLSTYLRADRVLKVSYTLAGGANLHEVWDRRATRTTDR